MPASNSKSTGADRNAQHTIRTRPVPLSRRDRVDASQCAAELRSLANALPHTPRQPREAARSKRREPRKKRNAARSWARWVPAACKPPLKERGTAQTPTPGAREAPRSTAQMTVHVAHATTSDASRHGGAHRACTAAAVKRRQRKLTTEQRVFVGLRLVTDSIGEHSRRDETACIPIVTTPLLDLATAGRRPNKLANRMRVSTRQVSQRRSSGGQPTMVA